MHKLRMTLQSKLQIFKLNVSSLFCWLKIKYIGVACFIYFLKINRKVMDRRTASPVECSRRILEFKYINVTLRYKKHRRVVNPRFKNASVLLTPETVISSFPSTASSDSDKYVETVSYG